MIKTTKDSLMMRIEQLQIEVDSLKSSRAMDQIQYKVNEQIEVIDQVNSFYDSAWNKLIITGVVVSVLVTILLPYLTNLVQRADLKALKEKLSNELKLDFSTRVAELTAEIEAKSVSSNSLIMKQIETFTLYNQASIYVSVKQIDEGLNLAVHAAHNWYTLGDMNNLEVVVGLVRTIVVVYGNNTIRLLKEKIKRVNPSTPFTIENLITKLKETDDPRFAKYISEIEEVLTKYESEQ